MSKGPMTEELLRQALSAVRRTVSSETLEYLQRHNGSTDDHVVLDASRLRRTVQRHPRRQSELSPRAVRAVGYVEGWLDLGAGLIWVEMDNALRLGWTRRAVRLLRKEHDRHTGPVGDDLGAADGSVLVRSILSEVAESVERNRREWSRRARRSRSTASSDLLSVLERVGQRTIAGYTAEVREFTGEDRFEDEARAFEELTEAWAIVTSRPNSRMALTQMGVDLDAGSIGISAQVCAMAAPKSAERHLRSAPPLE